MADQKAKLIIELEDLVSSKLNDIKSTILGLGATFLSFEGLKKIVEDTAAFGMEIERASQKTGVSVEQLERLKFAIEENGGSFDQLTNGLRFFQRAMVESTVSGGPFQLLFQQLGITVLDTNGKMRDTNSVFFEMIDKFNNLQSSAEKNAAAMKLFGRAGADMIPFLSLGSEEIQHLGDVAEGLGVVLNSNTIQQIKSFDEASQALTASLKGIELEIGTALMPYLSEMATEIIALKYYMQDTDRTQNTWLTALKEALIAAGATFTKILDPLGSVSAAMKKMTAEATQPGDAWEKAMSRAKDSVHNFATSAQKDHTTTTTIVQTEADKQAKAIQDAYEKEKTAVDVNEKYIDTITATRVLKAQGSFNNIASFHNQMVVRIAEDHKTMATIFADTSMKFVDSFSSGFAQVLVKGGSWKDAFKKIFDDLLIYFIEAIIKQMVEKWIASIIVMNAASSALGAPGGGGGVGGAVQSGATAAVTNSAFSSLFGSGAAGSGGLGGSSGTLAVSGVGTAIAAAGGAYLGNTLASKITGGGIGTDVGSGVGGAVGYYFGGPLGAAAGSFLGGTIGGSIQNLFSGGGDPNTGGTDLASVRANDAQGANPNVRGSGYQALEAYRKFKAATGLEPTQNELDTFVVWYSGGDQNGDNFLNTYLSGNGHDLRGAGTGTFASEHPSGPTPSAVMHLATGGIVLPQMGGTMARIGEGGQAEAVIPLSDKRAKNAIARSLGGGDTHIHINAGSIVADRVSAKQFAQMIDEELYKLKRRNQSVSLG